MSLLWMRLFFGDSVYFDVSGIVMLKIFSVN